MVEVYSKMGYDWDSQACLYAAEGEPGIHLEQHRAYLTVIDCLLYRDPDGHLAGILCHYNEGNLFQKPGSVNLWVRPDRQRQGIASVLLRDAWHRWSLDYADQTWTREGNAWLEGLVDKGKVNSELDGSLNEELDWREDPGPLEQWWR